MKLPVPELRVLAVAVLSVAGLVGVVAAESRARDAGTEVLLKMETVDPRSLLSGNYADIRLQELFNTDAVVKSVACPPGLAPGTARDTEGKPRIRWIALKPSGDHHTAAGAAETAAEARRFAPIVVKGTAACETVTSDVGVIETALVNLDVGVPRYYARQKEAERIAAAVRDRNAPVYAIVSVGADGKARLKGVMVEGKREELSLF